MFVINRVSEDGKTVQKLEESGNVFSADIVETLRLDWKPEDREKIYPERWERCLDRSDESLRDQNVTIKVFFSHNRRCRIKVFWCENLFSGKLEVFDVELNKGDDIGKLYEKIVMESNHKIVRKKMKVVSVKSNQCTGIFNLPTKELSEEMFLDSTIVVCHTLDKTSWDRQYLAVNLFDLGTQSFFGVPFLLEKPTESTGYDELRKKLERALSVFLTEKSDRSFGKKLDRWWNTRSNPDVVDVDAGRLNGVSFDVHKLVLIARSEIFEAMLTSAETRESTTNELVIPDIQPRIVKELLQYIYINKCNVEANALELFVSADKYFVNGLRLSAFNWIYRRNLPKLRHAIRLAEFGSFYNSEEIVEHAINQILISYPAIIKMPEWETFITKEPMLALRIFKKLEPRQSKCLF